MVISLDVPKCNQLIFLIALLKKTQADSINWTLETLQEPLYTRSDSKTNSNFNGGPFDR